MGQEKRREGKNPSAGLEWGVAWGGSEGPPQLCPNPPDLQISPWQALAFSKAHHQGWSGRGHMGCWADQLVRTELRRPT